jgi:hypothetical protein
VSCARWAVVYPAPRSIAPTAIGTPRIPARVSNEGLGGQLIEAQAGSTSDKGARGKVVCRSRLGGMLNFYYRQAA